MKKNPYALPQESVSPKTDPDSQNINIKGNIISGNFGFGLKKPDPDSKKKTLPIKEIIRESFQNHDITHSNENSKNDRPSEESAHQEYLSFFQKKTQYITYNEYTKEIEFANLQGLNIPVSLIFDSLSKKIQDSEELLYFRKFCGLVYQILRTPSIQDETIEGLFDSETVVSKHIQEYRDKYSKSVPRDRIQMEKSYLDHVLGLIRKGCWVPLSENDLQVCHFLSHDGIEVLNTEINWNVLDSQLFVDYFKKYGIESNGLSQKCLVFWRGMSTRPKTDTFFLSKLNNLSKMFYFDFFSKKPQLPDFNISDLQSSKCIFENSKLKREPLKIKDSWKLWKIDTVVEPCFDELLLLYRKETDHQVAFRRFYSIGLKDVDILFPIKKVQQNFFDYFSWFLLIIGLITLASKMWATWTQSSVLDEAIIAILTIFFPAIFQRYFKNLISGLTAKRLYLEKISSTVDAHSLNSNKSVLSYAKTEAHSQEFKQIILAYFLLYQWKKGLTKSELDAACEYFIKTEFSQNIDFNIDDAITALIFYELIKEENGAYFSVDLKNATNNLQKKLDDLTSNMFL